MKPVNVKLRSINTKFWDDNYVMELTSIEKLIFLYMISNSFVCLAGCYEITIKKIAFDTGIDIDQVGKTLRKFQDDKKIIYQDGFIIIINFLKNQSLNENMQTNVINTIDQLPANIKDVYIRSVKPLKGFQTFWKVEDEKEKEIEIKTVDKMEGGKEGGSTKKIKRKSHSAEKNNDKDSSNSNDWHGFTERTLKGPADEK